MRQSIVISVVLIAVLGGFPPRAACEAQNLLANGGFDHDLSSWSTQAQGLHPSWNAVDSDNAASSGSVRLLNDSPTDNGGTPTLASDCVALAPSGYAPGTRYRFGASTLVPRGQIQESQVAVFVYWYSSSGCLGPTLDSDYVPFVTSPGVWTPLEGEASVPPGARGAMVLLGFRKIGGGGQLIARFDDAFLRQLDGTCVSVPGHLCLRSARFRVEVDWRDFDDHTGHGTAVPETDDAGMFWFFQKSNVEMLVKVLDGCAYTDHYWVFGAATTNVEYTLKVTDLVGGNSRSYHNPLGVRSPAITDTTALASCP